MEILTQSGMAINEIRSIANTRHEDEDKSSVKSNNTHVQNSDRASGSEGIYQESQENDILSSGQDVVMEARTDRVSTTYRSEMNGDKNIETDTLQSKQEFETIPEEENEYKRNLETPRNMSTLNDQIIAENAKKAYESQKIVNPWKYNILFHQ